jgi:hypothetical protein
MHDPYPVFGIGETESMVRNLLFGGLALAALIYCVAVARREGKLWPVYVFGGSALLVIYEPFNNLLAQCAYPTAGAGAHDAILTWFGQHVPWSTWLIYMFYFSFAVPMLIKRLEAGMTVRQFFGFWGVVAVVCAAFEPLFAHPSGLRWWYYYGPHQALAFTGMPMFWVVANSMVVVAVGVIFYLLKKYVLTRDIQTIAFVPLAPLILFGVHGSAGIPVFVAISEGAGEIWSTMATFGSFAISFLYLWLMSRAVCVDKVDRSADAIRDSKMVDA